MLLKRRAPRIDPSTNAPSHGFEHLDAGALAVLRWLRAYQVEFVLVGPVAVAIRGQVSDPGPVSIVPAPYRRNFERLARALDKVGASVRLDGLGQGGATDTTPTKFSAERLSRGQLWTLRCGEHDLDIEGQGAGSASYQDLLYEATRFEPTAGLGIEVAAPEDIEHYAHLRRTGSAPEIRVIRKTTV
jgi:hypothetical protein